MPRTRLAAAVAAAVLTGASLLTAGCSDPPSHGYVYSVDYEPPGSYYTPGYWYRTCYGSGSRRTCYREYDPGYTTYVPPEWSIELCAVPGAPSSSNSCGWRDVDSQTYHTVSLGQCWSAVAGGCPALSASRNP